MKKIIFIFNKFDIVEWLLMIVSFILIICSYLISPVFDADRSVFSMITSLIGIIGIIFMSRGSIAAHYVYVIFSILYAILSIISAYYGEAIIYIFLMLPIHLMSIISWKNHMVNNNSKTVDISVSSYKVVLLLTGLSVIFTVPFHLLLKALNTDNLAFSTLSFGMNLVAAVLMLMRNKYFSLAFVIDDFFSILLWGAKMFYGTYKFIPMLIVCLVALSNDIYSFIKWCGRYRMQKKR